MNDDTVLRVDLNCDMGEGSGNDAAIMSHVTSANIACGAHAGDDAIMRDTLLLAARHGVAAGAHPGYPDREGFGRRRMDMTAGDVYDTVAQQVDSLLDHARTAGVFIRHVKPHGALYHAAATDAHVARAIARAVRDIDAHLLLYGLAGNILIAEAERMGLRAVSEAFADRQYEPDGSLTPRVVTGAMIDDPEIAAARVLRMVTQGRVQCSDGSDISVRAETICIHGDGTRAADIAREVRRVLAAAGVRVMAPERA